jgi:hypothetical protein
MGLVEAQSDVRGLIRSRVAFDAIESRINEIPDLAELERAALWLYAWSRQGRSWQRDTADQLLEWVGHQTMLPSGESSSPAAVGAASRIALRARTEGLTARGQPPA